MEKISVSKNDSFYKSSNNIFIKPGKKYMVSTQVAGIKGGKYCCYFGIENFARIKRFEKRRIKWLNDFSDEKLNKVVDEASIKNVPSSLVGVGRTVSGSTHGKWKKDFSEKE